MMAFIVVARVLTLCGCCVIPCARSLTIRLIEAAISGKPQYQLVKIDPEDLPDWPREPHGDYNSPFYRVSTKDLTLILNS